MGINQKSKINWENIALIPSGIVAIGLAIYLAVKNHNPKKIWKNGEKKLEKLRATDPSSFKIKSASVLISELFPSNWHTTFRQKPSNFCHFATFLGSIIDNPETREIFVHDIIPKRIQDLGNGKYRVNLHELNSRHQKAYEISEAELESAHIEGAKGLKILAKAFEKYLMEINPKKYKSATGTYLDTTGNIGIAIEALIGYHNMPYGNDYEAILNGSKNFKDFILCTPSKRRCSHTNIVSGHFYFIKNINPGLNGTITLTEPFNMGKETTITLDEYRNNFEHLVGFKKSEFDKFK